MPRTRWSQWSDWSPCDTDCLQTRRRRCLTNLAVDCPGQDYQVAQCLLCVRTSKSHIVNEGKWKLAFFCWKEEIFMYAFDLDHIIRPTSLGSVPMN